VGAKLGRVPISTSQLRTYILSTAATLRRLSCCLCNIIYNKGSSKHLMPSFGVRQLKLPDILIDQEKSFHASKVPAFNHLCHSSQSG